MRNLLAIAAAWILLGPAVLTAAETSLWRGTLGKRAVVVELGETNGRYFEEQELRDRILEGSHDAAGRWHLERKRELGDDDVLARWGLAPAGAALVGQAKSEGGKKDAIRLELVDVAALRAGKDGDRYRRGGVGDYDALRLGGLDLRRTRTTTLAGRRLRWWLQPRTGLSLFEVETGYDAATLERINAVLMDRLWKETAQALACMPGDTSPYESEAEPHAYHIKAEPRFLDARFLSVSLWTQAYCRGNVHGTYGDRALNLDVRSGRELALEDVLRIAKPGEAAAGGATPGPWILQAMRELHPGNLHEEECDYDDPGEWDGGAGWYLLPEGLYVHPAFVAMLEPCQNPDWSLLPWSLVEQHPGPALASSP